MASDQNMTKRPPGSRFRALVRFFIQGVIILAPIFITGAAIYWLFDQIDGILRPWVNIPGLGFVIILAFILLVGWISTSFLMGGIIHYFDRLMERTPVIKFIYSSSKDFFEAFAGDRKKFSRPVLANLFGPDIWIVGFLTDEELSKFELGINMVSVYVPQSYNFAGQLYLMPREKVRLMDHFPSGQLMKYAVTGGVVEMGTEESRAAERHPDDPVLTPAAPDK